MFLVARLIGGIGIGIASGLSPMYIAEVSPAQIRGKLVSLNQLTIVLGILAAQLANYFIAEPMPEGMTTAPLDSWNCQWGWRWMFWAEAFPAAAFLILAFFIPESPRWLAMRESVQDASEKRGGLKLLFTKPYHKILFLGVFIAVFQQWCGTNVIFNYAQEIFQGAGYDLGDMMFNIVLTGITNVIFTFVAIYTIDRIGRRKLMLAGAGVLALIYAVLGFCYYINITGFFMVILVVAAIACYAMTLGPATWVLLSEIFPDRVRATAMAVCTFSLWTASFILTYTFPILNNGLGSYGTFWIYAGICLVGYIFFIFRLPETKGKKLDELEIK